ncbi:MAG: MBOAT family protein [Candidatus Scalindua rubra]|nr:MBOAT family protein [Candidatus Scalindua rubra]TWU33058.1 Peptidoglycan O-acetyltransferase [Candidatus Brocadiaceae bacterium S225]
MLFNSLHFIFFFPVVVLLYFSIPQRWRWVLLLLASYYFYTRWKVNYAILLVTSTIVDYTAGMLMVRFPKKGIGRKCLLTSSLVANLGMLFTFKYYNFVSANLQELCDRFDTIYHVPQLDILLPLGISFYTFQTINYTIDVYRGHIEPEKHLGRFAVYVAFFPQLVAGPIERASHLIPQFLQDHRFNYQRLVDGFRIMLWGFFLKVVVADRLAVYVDNVYSAPHQYHGAPLLLATYFFAFQIYADFAGYSAIAIGSAKIMGFDLMENFRYPYLAASVSEFWKRWHISLSTWFRDYVYIPMGGNRVSKSRWIYNIMVLFLISGVWHGANWTFLVWGAIHGVYLITYLRTKRLQVKILRIIGIENKPRFKKILAVFLTFHLVLVAWIFFRANSIEDAGTILSNMVSGLPYDIYRFLNMDLNGIYEDSLMFVNITGFEFCLSITLILFVMMHDILRGALCLHQKLGRNTRYYFRMAYYDVLIIALILFGVYGQKQFIYFQF